MHVLKRMFPVKFLILSLSLFLHPSHLWSAQFLSADEFGTYPIAVSVNGSSGVQAYYSRYVPNEVGHPRTGELIIFVPGFDLSTSGDAVHPGSIESANKTSRKVNIGHHVNAQGSFEKVSFNIISDIGSTVSLDRDYLVEYLADRYGYDVLVVDFVNKNQSMLKNSQALEALLTDPDGPVMGNYRRGYKSTIIGFSMGGLISRYTLTNIEHNAKVNPISLYVSLDSPHGGAYLPASLEVFSRNLERKVNNPLLYAAWITNELKRNARKSKKLYDSEAAKELLGVWIGDYYVWIDNENKNILKDRYVNIEKSYHNARHSLFHNFRLKLRDIGSYPKQSRNIAFSNGNYNGRTSLENPGGKSGSTRDGNHLLTIHLFHGTWLGNNTLVKTSFFDDPITSKTNCKIEIQPGSMNCPLLSMPPQLRNISSAPGSTSEALLDLAENFDRIGEKPIHGDEKIPEGEGLLTFVPVLSALDIPSTDWFRSAKDIWHLSPFDATYANERMNTSHSRLSSELLERLDSEILTTEKSRRNGVGATVVTALSF